MQLLAQLLPELARQDAFVRTADRLGRGGAASVQGLSPAAQGLWIAGLVQQQRPRPCLVVVPTEEDGKRLLAELSAFGVDAAEPFPALEISPYERISPDPARHHQRQVALAGLRSGRLSVLVAAAKALMQVLPPVKAWEDGVVRLQAGMDLAPAALTQQLVRLGYRVAGQVSEYGEFSRRGGLLDVYSPGNPGPLRLEWFGDTLESIRRFDPATQRSILPQEAAAIYPTRDLILPRAGWDKIAAAVERQLDDHSSAELRRRTREDLDALNVFHLPEGCEYYLPLVTPSLATLLDYLPAEAIVVWNEPARELANMQLWAEEWGHAYAGGVARGELLALPEPLHRDPEQVDREAARFPRLYLYGLAERPEETAELETVAAPQAESFRGRIPDLVDAVRGWYRAGGQRVVLATAQPQRVLTIMQEHDCPARYGEALAGEPGLWVSQDGLPRGFRYPDLGLVVLTDAELFGWRQRPTRRVTPSRHPAGTPFTRVEDLKIGEYVIHRQHGIGQYMGLVQLTHDDTTREYLQLRYARDDKLYVPVEQMNLITRHRGAGDQEPRLHKLGGAEWENVKARVRKSVRDLAGELLQIYAQRAKREGYAFPPDTEWQREMEAGFPYRETSDQLQAILDTKADMEQLRPMDRLVCGDVGFGKTEVAIRAAFKAIMAGKQVAILAPTTVLTQQHFDTFTERFAPYPVRIGLLSRFRSNREAKEVTDGLRQGTLDLVIGTHRLLQKAVKFRDLGLLVIDEEHRFGVAQKEKIKAQHPDVDILSLSATPIPRTLNMALSGIRDLSVINTPPENRLPVKTRVVGYGQEVIRRAVLQELERNGQVFFVHNRIETLDRVVADLREAVPGVRMGIGHGQLPEHELENLMLAFLNREFDVLVCTTIIESGLDIPSANTIVIDRADALGLAQLYQLRGRVGRADVQAHAWCLYNAVLGLSEVARERLQALQDFSELGSGYQIALRDMEIRGVGNLLGGEQHGHVLAVGFDMYVQLLEEAVNELKTEEGAAPPPARHAEVLIDLDIPAFVPDSWLADPRQKMHDYRRLAAMAALDEVDRLEREWQDRYGPIPAPASNLLKIVRLRLRAMALDVAAIRMKGKLLEVDLAIAEAEWQVVPRKFPELQRWSRSGKGLYTPQAVMTPEDNLLLLTQLFAGLEWARRELRVAS